MAKKTTNLLAWGSHLAASQVPDLLTEKNIGMRWSEVRVPRLDRTTQLVEGLRSTLKPEV